MLKRFHSYCDRSNSRDVHLFPQEKVRSRQSPDDTYSEITLIWSDPVNLCGIMGLFLLLLSPYFEDRASRSRGRFERRLISLIFAGRDRIIVIRRELPPTKFASPAEPVA
jgi:hypothetical protein